MNNYQFELKFKVRDYECDLQGVVNNSVYQNYLEHTRHEFLNTIGLDFAELFRRGTMAVVARADIQYKTPLKSGDEFICRLNAKKEGIKYLFYQDIYRLPDEKVCIKAIITTVTLVNGKLAISEELEKAILENGL
ncbi:MAG: acyl-CoA thioesterase [Salinivirgaceae bacterium]